MSRSDLVDVDLRYLGERGDAFLFRDGDDIGDPEHWLPKSLVDLGGDPQVDKTISVTMPEWKAEELGLV